MGMFDTFQLQWGDVTEDLQTKQLACMLTYWRIGERIPLAELGTSEYGLPEIETEKFSGSFETLIEDWTIGNYWANKELCDRYFVLGISHGRWADYASFQTVDQAKIHANELAEIWTNPDYSTGLAKHFALIIERNNIAEQAKNVTLAAIDPTFLSWRKQKIEDRNTDPENIKKKFFLRYRGPDFGAITRMQTRVAVEHATDHWSEQYMDFTQAIEPHTQNTAECALALELAKRSTYSQFGLGAPSIADLASISDPASTSPKDKASILKLLAQGQWFQFEKESSQFAKDADFCKPVQAYLKPLFISRIGASWASTMCAKYPQYAPQSISAGGDTIDLATWCISGLGLPSRMVKPLIAISTDANLAQMAHYALLPHYKKIFSIIFELAKQRPQARHALEYNGASLIEQALLTSNQSALKQIISDPAFNPEKEMTPKLLSIAINVEKREARDYLTDTLAEKNSKHDFSSLPDELSCIKTLLDHGIEIDSNQETSLRLIAYLAFREKNILDQAIPRKARKPKSSRL